ncbi:BREX-2 system adenine-specific DNA-methyltransferase PglX [Cellulomonas chengniuliangii]|uniref:BREX-2 system adenine-specific DNA-methyltransferase PglX n=1 Tax=Cellulomonas chengniuliangii TaxID=2968084 RepID=UPI001D0DDBCD|nr:BREX-2 system adenine-specific DNA-methyltransferase PglX [Cellulomonas chengniuliangii]MCC2316568.1 BREX-2 system adenine-specific DNA-methyltransferase PglX [Cellulomonas chengniuliangii]
MIRSSALLADLKAQLKVLQADLKARADDPTTEWGATLQQEHAEALRRERTGLSWTAWRDNEVDQAAVAWIIATTFIRFCEDNDLLAGATLDGTPVPVGWIAGPGDRTARARENQTAYYRVHTSHHDRDWLQQAFRVLAAQPAGAALVDPKHNPVWTAEISAEAAKGLVNFWRRTGDDGTLIHDFTDPELDTRFLGDLYQDLSEHAKKTYALLQTPEFVEEFILDRTLTPAIAEFGIEGLKLIDPTCGSGHFLLGAFERLNERWAAEAPGLDAKQRVRKAMDSIHGVDLNPFAVAIARFRLTVAGIQAAGEKSLVGVSSFGFHLAIGDSLLGEQGGGVGLFDDSETFMYDTEDLDEYAGILKPGQYHVVVGNPPYITVKDKVLNQIYRQAYSTAAGKYALSVPFMELFFRLAVKGGPNQGAGHVGQITSNSFMKREFGKKVIEEFFAGFHTNNPVDLTHVIDTSGAYIPGHGTPTVILVGRRRRPVAKEVRAILGVRGEPGQPEVPSKGLVWTEIVEHVDVPGFDGTYVTVADLSRGTLSSFPWSLSGGGASGLFEGLNASGSWRLKDSVRLVGVMGMTNIDDAFLNPPAMFQRNGIEPELVRPLVTGDLVRDFVIASGDDVLFAYGDGALLDIHHHPTAYRWLWPVRTESWNRATFAKVTYREEGRTWWEWHQIGLDRVAGPTITFAFVATHNHFVLDRGGKVFKQSAPVIKLPEGATEEQHLELLGVLNSSTACFWLKQVSHNKGNGGIGGGIGDEDWEPRYEFTGTKLQEFPLPAELPGARGASLDSLARALGAATPGAVVADWMSASREHPLADMLDTARAEWFALRRRLVFEQEELDWETYRLYGLSDEDLTYHGEALDQIILGERAFEVALARKVRAGEEETSWFDRHGSTPLCGLPAEWPADYRELVEKRLAAIEADRSIRLLERPEYKRRWATVPWERQLQEALESAILDRLEEPRLWTDYQGPVARSVAQLADQLRGDHVLQELTRALTGNREPDLAAVIESLAPKEAVPYLAAHRYKPSGLEKFREWQSVWDLQRREDAGEKVTIPVPPKYTTADFQKVEYWKARGKLDVPKERFVLYPGVGREGDTSPVLGWAGWNHRDQAVALVREILTQKALGASNEALVPMVAGLVELEPWLHQWHTGLEPEFGSSAAQAVTSQIDQLLAQLQMTRDDVNAWRPPAATRGRRPRS